MKHIFQSITMKICFTILVVETLLLSVMGIYYVHRFWKEIDQGIDEKMRRPGILMEQRALNFNAVTDFSALEETIQEKITDAFITRPDGSVFYAKDSSRTGKAFHHFLDPNDPLLSTHSDLSSYATHTFTSTNGKQYISILDPLVVNNRLLGMLHIRIDSEKIQTKKNEILYLFLFGSIATILLTTLLEALLVHLIFVPRINSTSSALKKVEDGNLSTRIAWKGSGDQLNLLIEQVNSMIARIESNTDNLHLLNKAGEAFAESMGRAETGNIIIEVLEQYLGTSLTASEKNNLQEKVTDFGEGVPFADELTALVQEKTRGRDIENRREFILTLCRLITNTLKREQALEEIRSAEQKYRDLFTSATEGIFRTSLDGRLLIANPSLLTMFGYDSSELCLPTDYDFVHDHYVTPGDRVRILDQIARDGQVHDFEVKFRRRDGSVFWASLSGHTTEIDDGDTILVIDGRIIDISERKLREEAEQARQVAEATGRAQVELLRLLEEKNEKLQETLSELGQTHNKLLQSEKMTAIGMTASGVAHDLNNILSGIISYPELLLLKLPAESEFRQPLEAIMASGKRAAAVVADLLTLARDAAQTRETRSLNDLITDYLQSPEFGEIQTVFPDICIETDLHEDLFNIHCSGSHIHKVIMNLVLNALEAVRTSGTIRIITDNLDPTRAEELLADLTAGDYVVMHVIDSGPGIGEEDLPHIFDPFYTKKVMGRSGTGLGLTVVRNVIEEHHGIITANNSEKGTIFSVYLPATQEKKLNQTRYSSLNELKGSGSILVVDDEQLQRDIATQMLVQLGYRVAAVSSGEEALFYLRDKPVDMILLDMLMPPGMNGRETYEKIQMLRPGQKAIIASGFSKDDDVQITLQLGAQGLLEKPYTMEELGKAIRCGLE